MNGFESLGCDRYTVNSLIYTNWPSVSSRIKPEQNTNGGLASVQQQIYQNKTIEWVAFTSDR